MIADKRLASVFQRAGMFRPFRLAQLRVAKKLFYPADNRIAVTIDGQVVEGKVSDVVKSEAGLATLLDRKVNTGSLSPINSVLTQMASRHKVKSIDELSKYESELIAKMKYRSDYSKDANLTQPSGAPPEPLAMVTPTSKRAASRPAPCHTFLPVIKFLAASGRQRFWRFSVAQPSG